MAEPRFPDPGRETAGYFATAFSFSNWLAERWTRQFEFDELLRIGFHCNTPPRLCLRVNSLRTSRDELLETMEAAGIGAQPGDVEQAVWIDDTHPVAKLPGFEKGWFAVQDESAMRASLLLNPRPGKTVLDLCAAPGTKTTHLAELMRDEGRIVACDVKPDRLKRVAENTARLGVSIVEAHPVPEDLSAIPPGPYDAVLVDAPCSNTGVLAKRPEARWRIDAGSLAECAQLQKRLLDAACRLVQPGGRIVYSTCSIEPEENGDVVRAAIERCDGVTLVEECELRPGEPADGGYQALLRSKSPSRSA